VLTLVKPKVTVMSVADVILKLTGNSRCRLPRIPIVTVGALSLSVIVPVAVSVVDPLFL
jgi:hypothetical protein